MWQAADRGYAGEKGETQNAALPEGNAARDLQTVREINRPCPRKWW